MFSVQIDITEQMQGFSKFAKQNDVNHAMNEILLICRKTMMPPRTVLYQIAEELLLPKKVNKEDKANLHLKAFLRKLLNVL